MLEYPGKNVSNRGELSIGGRGARRRSMATVFEEGDPMPARQTEGGETAKIL